VSAWLLRSVAAGSALLLLVFALVAYRVSERGARELAESERAFDAGRLEIAVEHARRAATAYVPGAPHVQLAFERLAAVARGAERTRDLALARRAWRATRAAAIESRHLWQPHAARLAAAELELARLAQGPEPGVEGALVPRPVPLSPSPALRVLALMLGAALGLGGLLAACSPGVYAELRPARRRQRLALASCLLGVAVWSAALLGA
jgi:hypothetical protein